MKICVVGAGAIGGFIAVRLAHAGHEVSVVARGPHLEAIRAKGLRLLEDDRELVADDLTATDRLKELGQHDIVMMALKAHQIGVVIDDLPSLFNRDTVMVTLQNGIPWWYFHALDGPHEGRRLDSVDPGGSVWDAVGPQRVLGCIAYPATEIEEPGVVRHIEGDRFSLGEPDGSKSERVQRLADTFRAAGLRAPVRTRIRNELWVKLWGNVAFNPISALTGMTLAEICADPEQRAIAREAMVEAQAVAGALREEFRIDVDQRIEGAAAVGAHKTSMLQDIERGRRTEIDAIAGAGAELGRVTGVPTPRIDSLHAQVTALDG